MNIVFLSHEYPLWASGGVGTFLQTFGRSLSAKGHRVTVLGVGTSDNEESMDDEGVRLIRLSKNKSRLPNFLYNARVLNRKLRELQKENPIDIIESAELGLAIISKKHPAKKVIRLHGGHHFFAEAERRGINWRKGFLEKRSFSKADGFIAVSNYVKTHTAKFLSYHNKPIEVINLPVNISVEVSNVAVESDSILFAGTVCEKKGVRELLQAFTIVREKFPEKRLDLYGRDWYYPDGRSYIEEMKNTFAGKLENVTFHGAIDRTLLMRKYAESAFCVFPSHMETQGLVCLEAMLLKKPVIFSKYGPGPETVEDGKTGLLCDVYSPEDLAQKMIWMIENEKSAYELGQNAYFDVKQRYNENTILEQNIAFYKSL
ncbi:MAG: glycosyltransferase family 4 protein [Flavobacteriaceae bacterium]|nr:glycosyltransferase family 4 protein [Flavobacteriaceae bacterium]